MPTQSADATTGRPESTGSSPRCPWFRAADGRGVLVRPYRAADRARLLAIYGDYPDSCRTMGTPPRTDAALADWLDEHAAAPVTVVAVRGDRRLGHAVAAGGEPADDGGLAGGTVEIGVYVHPDYFGRGIGTELVRQAAARAGAAGAEEAIAVVAPTNRRAQRVFERVGFEAVETEHRERLYRLPLHAGVLDRLAS